MGAFKYSQNSELRNKAEEARIFFEHLGKMKYGDNFQLNKNLDDSALTKLKEHFEEFSNKDGDWSVPEKGLLIVASYESEAVILFRLLNSYLDQLFMNEKRKYNNLKACFRSNELTVNIVSTHDLEIELKSKSKVLDVLNKHVNSNLCLLDFGKDQIVGIDNYNKVDVVLHLLRKRYLNYTRTTVVQSSSNYNLFYLLSDLSFEELKDRYGNNTLFHIKKLVDFIVLSSPKTDKSVGR
jgi:hypothetical protein